MENFATTTGTNCQPSNFYYYQNGMQYEANFKSPTKRSFLNECIRQIYILNGKAQSVPVTPSPVEFDQNQILHMLNILLAPPTIANDHRSSLERVKRQLFRETKRKSRKSNNPQKVKSQQMQLYYFKALRFVFGVKKLRRHYMEEPRHHSKRKLTFSDTENVALKKSLIVDENARLKNILNVHIYQNNPHVDNIYHNPQHNRQNCKFKKLHNHMLEEQYRNQLYMNERMLEESLRSLFYMKALLNLMVDQEETLYV